MVGVAKLRNCPPEEAGVIKNKHPGKINPGDFRRFLEDAGNFYGENIPYSSSSKTLRPNGLTSNRPGVYD